MNGRKLLWGFNAGFLATLVFHQSALAILWQLGIAPFAPLPMQPTWPFDVPALISLAFWGGIWGIIFVHTQRLFPRSGLYWPSSFLFGALAPSLVALFIVLPLKGGAVAGDWQWQLLVTALTVNGAWGIGTALIYWYRPGRN